MFLIFKLVYMRRAKSKLQLNTACKICVFYLYEPQKIEIGSYKHEQVSYSFIVFKDIIQFNVQLFTCTYFFSKKPNWTLTANEAGQFGASAEILYISMVDEILNGYEKACFENVYIAFIDSICLV